MPANAEKLKCAKLQKNEEVPMLPFHFFIINLCVLNYLM